MTNSLKDIIGFQQEFQPVIQFLGLKKVHWDKPEWEKLFNLVNLDVYADMHLKRAFIKHIFDFHPGCRILPTINLYELRKRIEMMNKNEFRYFELLCNLVEFEIPCDSNQIDSYVKTVNEIVSARMGGMIQINRFSDEKQDFYVYIPEISYPFHLIIGNPCEGEMDW